jgi:flavin reductase (DIM6/NTAB) family NADH-FMN oxidoreductase RutF
MKIAEDRLRHTFGHLPTGVSVVTGYAPNGPIGMSANSVTSLSLDPPLLLFCPAKTSQTWPVIRRAGRFCVNVLAHHHERSARLFAARGVDSFLGSVIGERLCGPALSDAVAWIDCELVEEMEGGDHTIVVASILDLDARDGIDPLVFFKGSYGTFTRVDVDRTSLDASEDEFRRRIAAES